MTETNQNAYSTSAESRDLDRTKDNNDPVKESFSQRSMASCISKSKREGNQLEFLWAVVIEKIYQHDGTEWKVRGATRRWNNGVLQTAHSAQFDPNQPYRVEPVEHAADLG